METSVTVLVDAKREYTKQLIQAIRPYLLNGVLSIYDEAFNVCQENKEADLTMLTFQELLQEVPKWNNVMITDETERIINESQCDYLEDLLTAVFVCHTKILTTVRVNNKDRKVNLKVPCVENFLHQVYIEMARQFWKHPYLLNPLDVSKIKYQQNLKTAETIIHDCLESTIRKLLPVKDILKEYLVEDNDSDEDTDDVDVTNASLDGQNKTSDNTVSTSSTKDGYNDDEKKKPTETDKTTSTSTKTPIAVADKKKDLQEKISKWTSGTDVTYEKESDAKNATPSSTSTDKGILEKSAFNAMLDAIEGKPSSSSPKSNDIKTVSTTGTKVGSSLFDNAPSPTSSTTSTSSDATKKVNISTPTLSLNTTKPTPTSSSTLPGAASSPITPLSIESLTSGNTSTSASSPTTGTTTSASEISLDNLGSIEEVKVDFGKPSSPTPSIQNDVLSEFDKMAKTGSPTSSPTSSPISSPTAKPYTFF